MKKFTNLMIVCSLVLAGAVMAQTPAPEEEQSPSSKKQRPERKQPAEVKPGPKPDAPAVKDPAATRAPAAPKPERKAPEAPKPMPPETKPQEPATSATPDAKTEKTQRPSRETKKSPAADASVSPAAKATVPPTSPKTAVSPPTTAASATPAAKATSTPAAATGATATPAAATTASATPAAATASATPATAATASAAPSVAQTSPTTSATVNPSAPKKPEPSKIQQIRERHANFRAQALPDRVPAVTFSTGYRIQGSDQWQGPQYEVYRSYRPERHDQAYYRSRYQRVELIAGGYYYFHNNYWYPAWGYSPQAEYYAYDAPIYAGKRALPPDKVIAEVQAALQEMGYYKGEVDGLLGPLTRQALMGYQRDNGMTVTAVIDEPTLDSLDMG